MSVATWIDETWHLKQDVALGRAKEQDVDVIEEASLALAHDIKNGFGDARPSGSYHPLTEAFLDAVEEIKALHLRKGRDYGTGQDPFANVRATGEWGVPAWVGAMVRANDKVARLKSYVANGRLANEGVEDSLQDLAVYALIALVLFREQEGLL